MGHVRTRMYAEQIHNSISSDIMQKVTDVVIFKPKKNLLTVCTGVNGGHTKHVCISCVRLQDYYSS